MARAPVYTTVELCARICGLLPGGRSLVGRKVPVVFCWPLMSIRLVCCYAPALVLSHHSSTREGGGVLGVICTSLTCTSGMPGVHGM